MNKQRAIAIIDRIYDIKAARERLNSSFVESVVLKGGMTVMVAHLRQLGRHVDSALLDELGPLESALLAEIRAGNKLASAPQIDEVTS